MEKKTYTYDMIFLDTNDWKTRFLKKMNIGKWQLDSEVSILVLEKPVLSPKMPRRETRVVTGRRIGRQKWREGYWEMGGAQQQQRVGSRRPLQYRQHSVICRVRHHQINLSVNQITKCFQILDECIGISIFKEREYGCIYFIIWLDKCCYSNSTRQITFKQKREYNIWI